MLGAGPVGGGIRYSVDMGEVALRASPSSEAGVTASLLPPGCELGGLPSPASPLEPTLPPTHSPLELGELSGLPSPEPEACGVHCDGAEVAAE